MDEKTREIYALITRAGAGLSLVNGIVEKIYDLDPDIDHVELEQSITYAASVFEAHAGRKEGGVQICSIELL